MTNQLKVMSRRRRRRCRLKRLRGFCAKLLRRRRRHRRRTNFLVY